MVQTISGSLFIAKLMLTYCHLDPKEQIYFNRYQNVKVFYQENAWQPFCRGHFSIVSSCNKCLYSDSYSTQISPWGSNCQRSALVEAMDTKPWWQVIVWTNTDFDVWSHTALPDHNELRVTVCINHTIQIVSTRQHLTHWGRVTHICVGRQIIIGSDNGLSPGRRQAITWTNARILLIGPLGTHFSEISIKILTFSFTKMRLKVSSAKWCPLCLGLNVLTNTSFNTLTPVNMFFYTLGFAWLSQGQWSYPEKGG